MRERCRLISESQWREYQELVTKCHRLEQLLESETLAKQEGVELVAELEYRLKEAEKVIKNIHHDIERFVHYCDCCGYEASCSDCYCNDTAKEYLEKYGVKND